MTIAPRSDSRCTSHHTRKSRFSRCWQFCIAVRNIFDFFCGLTHLPILVCRSRPIGIGLSFLWNPGLSRFCVYQATTLGSSRILDMVSFGNPDGTPRSPSVVTNITGPFREPIISRANKLISPTAPVAISGFSGSEPMRNQMIPCFCFNRSNDNVRYRVGYAGYTRLLFPAQSENLCQPRLHNRPFPLTWQSRMPFIRSFKPCQFCQKGSTIKRTCL